MSQKPKNIVGIISVLLLFIASIAVLIIKWDIIDGFIKAASNHTSAADLKIWLEGWPIPAEIVFIFIQFLQVVIFVIPGEVTQIASGYLFGTFWGTIFSLIGIALGSWLAFMVTRMFGQPFVEKLFKREQILRFEIFISSPKAKIAYFLWFLIPALPKDIMCYLAGLSKLKPGTFVLLSMVARIPSMVASTMIGSAIADGNPPLAFVIGGVALLIFLIAFWNRDRLHLVVERLLHKPHHEAPHDKTPESNKNSNTSQEP